MVGGRGDDQAEWTCIAEYHCRVPISVSYLRFFFQGHQSHPDNQENNNEFCLELLADVALFSTLITQKLFFAIWGLCWYISRDSSKSIGLGDFNTSRVNYINYMPFLP